MEGIVETVERSNNDSDLDMNRVREERDELVNQLATAQAAVVSLTEKHAQGRDELKLLKQDSEAKIEISLEKCKRLKTLLAKSKQMSQEKEIEMTKLMASGTRPKRFGIQNRISLPLYACSKEEQMWCLIFEDGITGLGLKTC